MPTIVDKRSDFEKYEKEGFLSGIFVDPPKKGGIIQIIPSPVKKKLRKAKTLKQVKDILKTVKT